MSSPKLRLVRTPPPGFTPLQLAIYHAQAAEAALEECLEAIGPNLDALNEVQDAIVEGLLAVREIRERAVTFAFERGELIFRVPQGSPTT